MDALQNNNDSLFSLPKSTGSSESSNTSPSFPIWIILFILILVLAYFYLNYGFDWINDSISSFFSVNSTSTPSVSNTPSSTGMPTPTASRKPTPTPTSSGTPTPTGKTSSTPVASYTPTPTSLYNPTKTPSASVNPKDSSNNQNPKNTLNASLQGSSCQLDQSYFADDAYNSPIQTSKPVSKSGWCYIGEDRGFRSCIRVGEYDKCMSGDIFPNQKMCVNPNIRK